MFLKFITIPILFFGSSLILFSQSDDLIKFIKTLSSKELVSIQAVYADCVSNPGNCYGDSLFYKTWLDGLENEVANKLDKAVDFYNKALKISRFELSTYEVNYSLGRIEILKGNIEKGIEILNRFITKAKAEINDENSMWGFSEDGLKDMNQTIDNAKKLILKCH